MLRTLARPACRTAGLRVAGVASAIVSVVAPIRAQAAELHVFTVEQQSWAATVATLESDVRGEGQTVHVYVVDDQERRIPCASYTLSLDAVADSAFAIGACDPITNATAVRLAHRTALFSHDDDVPRPLTAGISAVQVRTGGAAGRAGTVGGSTVQCSIAVRPFVTDLEHGNVVYLAPGRYQLRPIGQGIGVDPGANGWTLRRQPGAALSVEYDVLDTQRGEVVLHERATLACAATPLRSESPVATGSQPAERPASSSTVAMNATVTRDCTNLNATPDYDATRVCAAAPELVSGSTVHGSTVGGEDHFRSRCAQSAAGPDDVYLLRITQPSNVSLRLSGNYDGALSLRSQCAASGPELACNDDAPDFRHSALSANLAPGIYYVVVDGSGSDCGGRSAGAYELTTLIEPEDRSPAFVRSR